mmetsp:Transcript_81747/g.213173  ORF Transcript_81747/g.213173 Transcript_81747/m.213173 type:complete len:650 (+) Transcript_81747:45-1994(+)
MAAFVRMNCSPDRPGAIREKVEASEACEAGGLMLESMERDEDVYQSGEGVRGRADLRTISKVFAALVPVALFALVATCWSERRGTSDVEAAVGFHEHRSLPVGMQQNRSPPIDVDYERGLQEGSIWGAGVTWGEGTIRWSRDANMCLTHTSDVKNMINSSVEFVDCVVGASRNSWIVPFGVGLIRVQQHPLYCISNTPGSVSLQYCNDSHPEMNWQMPGSEQGPVRPAWVNNTCMQAEIQVPVSGPVFTRKCNTQLEHVPLDLIFLVPWQKPEDPLSAMLRGEYGYLSDFNVSESIITDRIQEMHKNFGIMEFQLYAAFGGFSHPPHRAKDSWNCVLGDRIVRLKTLSRAAAEIQKLGGRSWFYLHAGATDPSDATIRDGFTSPSRAEVQQKILQRWFEVAGPPKRSDEKAKQYEETCGCPLPEEDAAGNHRTPSQPGILQDYVALNPAWAIRFVPQWAEFLASLGISGIHWDNFGDLGDPLHQLNDIPGFLRTAAPHLHRLGLEQTFNFVDGFGWDASLLAVGVFANPVVAFAYWEVWSNPSVEEHLFGTMKGISFVWSSYPGFSQFHCCRWNEQQNAEAYDITPLELGATRWERAIRAGGSYLFIGDGMHHVQSPYLPDVADMSQEDVATLRARLAFYLPSLKTFAA